MFGFRLASSKKKPLVEEDPKESCAVAVSDLAAYSTYSFPSACETPTTASGKSVGGINPGGQPLAKSGRLKGNAHRVSISAGLTWLWVKNGHPK